MSDTAVPKIAAIFAKTLTGEWTRKRTPHGFDKALQKAQGLTGNDPERILLSIGFKAWISYFLTRQGNSNHYIGRAENLWAIATLKKLSVESQKEVAKRIIDTPAHATVSEAIDQLRRRKRSARELCRNSLITSKFP